jgi:hypothetical protein
VFRAGNNVSLGTKYAHCSSESYIFNYVQHWTSNVCFFGYFFKLNGERGVAVGGAETYGVRYNSPAQ